MGFIALSSLFHKIFYFIESAGHRCFPLWHTNDYNSLSRYVKTSFKSSAASLVSPSPMTLLLLWIILFNESSPNTCASPWVTMGPQCPVKPWDTQCGNWGQDEPTDPQRAILVMIWAMVVYSIDDVKAKNHPGEPGWLNVPEHWDYVLWPEGFWWIMGSHLIHSIPTVPSTPGYLGEPLLMWQPTPQILIHLRFARPQTALLSHESQVTLQASHEVHSAKAVNH